MEGGTRGVMATSRSRRQAEKTAPRRLASRDRLPDPGVEGPTLGRGLVRLAERARAETWSHEEFLVACLQREVSARESHGGESASAPPGFPPARRSRSSTSTTARA